MSSGSDKSKEVAITGRVLSEDESRTKFKQDAPSQETHPLTGEQLEAKLEDIRKKVKAALPVQFHLFGLDKN